MNYDKPKMDVIVFATEDVVRTSNVTVSPPGEDGDIIEDF